MATTAQIVPDHEYAYTKVVVNDNSARPADAASTALETYCNLMFVFSSPKGIDRQLQTVSGGFDDFVERYGLGTFDTYGQPYLNAYAAAKTNAATLHCLRVTADDATYAAGALVAHYKATPGTPAVESTVTSSSLVDLMGHDGMLAADEVDENGNVTLTIAGVNVEPGISEENQETFGDLAGEYVDVVLNLAKIVTLDADKTYRITQVNPALAEYVGKDAYITENNGVFTKEKVYSGSALMDGYSLLLGASSSVKVTIQEWGELAEAEIVVNATDLAVRCSDDKAAMNITALGSAYDIVCDGDAVPGVVNADLWGAISGNNLELALMLPNLDSSKTYYIVQANDNMAQFAGDPSISEVDGTWKKAKGGYPGDGLATEGYSVLLGDGTGDVGLKVFDESTFVSEAVSTPVMTVTVHNNYTWVSAHAGAKPTGPLGDPTVIDLTATIGFTTDVARSSSVRATMAYTQVTNMLASTATEAVPATPGRLDLFYTFDTIDNVTDITELGYLVDVDGTPDANGYKAVKVLEMACRGRGSWGNNVRFMLSSYARGDRLSAYKNYILSIYEINKATLTKKEEYTVAFSSPDAVSTEGSALYAEYLVGDPYKSSSYVSLMANPAAITEMFAVYAELFPDTSLNELTFDPLCGAVYGASASKIPGLYIDQDSVNTVSLTGASGVSLNGGSDGGFAAGNVNRLALLNEAYLKAYSGEIDRNVRSKKLYPTDIIFDAGFTPETKLAIHELVAERQDCSAMYDLGTDMNTYAAMLAEMADVESFINLRDESIEAYRGKAQDPVSYKLVNVTSTYALAQMYPTHFQQSNGHKHVALAGSSYGVVSGFISGSAWPVYDDDLDQDILDELTRNRVNYLKINTKKQVVRGAQNTRQDIDTNLSEISNVLVLHDIRRDAVQLCEQYEYNFSETSDLQRFNKAAGILAEKYQDAQVKSISATFDMNDWESERGILHLHIDFIHKDIIKRSIVEINVNRGKVVNS